MTNSPLTTATRRMFHLLSHLSGNRSGAVRPQRRYARAATSAIENLEPRLLLSTTGLSGTISYTGAATGSIMIAAFTDPNFNTDAVASVVISGPGAYTIPLQSFQAGKYYIVAYRDVNGDGKWEPASGEPFGLYGVTGVPVQVSFAGTNIANLNFSLAVPTGTVPTLVSSTPANGQTVAVTSHTVSFTFSKAMAPNESVTWTGTLPSYADPTWSADRRTVTYTFAQNFAPNQTIGWELNNAADTDAFVDYTGNKLANRSGSFTTGSAVNHLPVLTNVSRSVGAGGTLDLRSPDFFGGFTDQDFGDTLQTLKIITLPTHGTLKLNGTAVTAGQVIGWAPNGGLLTYTPDPANDTTSTAAYTGTDSFSWSASDGTAYATAAANMNLTVAPLFNLADYLQLNPSTSWSYSATRDGAPITITQSLAATPVTINGTATLDRLWTIQNQAQYQDHEYYTINASGLTLYRHGWLENDGTPSTDTYSSVVLFPASGYAGQTYSTSFSLSGQNAGSLATWTGNGTVTTTVANEWVSVNNLPYYTYKLQITTDWTESSGAHTTTVDTRWLAVGLGDVQRTITETDVDPSGVTVSHQYALSLRTYTSPNAPAIRSLSASLPENFGSASIPPGFFLQGFQDQDTGDTIQKIKIVVLPTHSVLRLNNVPVTLNQEISVYQLNNFTYTPNPGYFGDDGFAWNASDGGKYADSAAGVNILLTTPQQRLRVLAGGNEIAFGDTTPSRDDYTDFGPITAPSVSAPAGSVTRTFYVQNIGQLGLNLTGGTLASLISISGVNASDFTVTTAPTKASLEGSGDYISFVVTFTPSAAGLRTAKVTIASNDPLHPLFSFAIQGTGLVTTVGSDGLQIAITKAGTGVGALAGQELHMNYTGYLLDGTKFDSSLNPGRTPFDFTVGMSDALRQVIVGWNEGMLGMKVGEKRTLIIPAALAYGDGGTNGIPGGSVLIFETELLAIVGPTLKVTGSNNTAITDGDTTPATTDGTDFGTILPGATVTRTFTIANVASVASSGSLQFLGTPNVQLTGTGAAQFAVTQPVTANNTITFTVTYQPAISGTASALITIPTNDPAHPNYHFTIQGAMVPLSGHFASSIALPATVGTGDTFKVPVIFTNTGLATATATVRILLKASVDGIWHDSDPTLVDTNQVVSLARNGSGTYILNATVPASLAPSATPYVLVAKFEALPGVSDPVLTTNLITTVGTDSGPTVPLTVVPALPDLVVAFSPQTPNYSTYVPGDTITLPLTVTNNGIRSAVGTVANPIRIEIRSSATSAYDPSGALLTQLTIPYTLTRGTAQRLTATFKLPASITPGSFYVTAMVDSSGIVAELSESNNTAGTAALNFDRVFGNIPGRTGSIPLTFNDADGTAITFNLTGPGLGHLFLTGGSALLNLTGTTAASTLQISTVKTTTPGDDGRFTLHDFTVGVSGDHTAFGTLIAATTDLTGDISISGPATRLTLGNVTGPNIISIGSPAVAPLTVPSVSLTFDQVLDTSLTSAIGIQNLTVTRWRDSDANDTITALFLGTLNVTGRVGTVLTAIAGDFQPSLTLTGPNGATAATPTFQTGTIAGSVAGSTWDITGKIGTLSIAGTVGTATPFTLQHASDISSLTLGDVANAVVTVSGNVTTLSAKRWQAGSLSAKTLGTLNVTGVLGVSGYAGDFQADMTLTGPATLSTANVLGSATIAGVVGGKTWDITGKVGSISIAGALGSATAFTLQHASDISTLTLGDVSKADVTVSGNITTLSVKRWQAGSVSAKTLGTLNVTGVLGASGYAGNFQADLTLSGPATPSTANVLGSATIAGSVGAHTWTVPGKIGTLSIAGTLGTVDTPLIFDQVTDLNTVTFGDVINARLNGSGRLTTVTAKRWQAGAIKGGTITTLNITGAAAVGATPAIPGDLGAMVWLDGSPTLSLGQLSVANQLSNAFYTGHPASFGTITAKSANGVIFTTPASTISSLTLSDSTATNTLSLDAISLQTLTIKGNLSNSQINLSQAVSSTVKALGTVMAGRIVNSQIRTVGNIGAITASALDHSLIYAGVQAIDTLPAAPADFQSLTPTLLPTIASLTLTAPTATPTAPVLIASNIAAGTITYVSLPTRLTAISDGGTLLEYGFATRTAAVRTYLGPLSTGLFVSGKASLVT